MKEILDFVMDNELKYEVVPIGGEICIYKDEKYGYIRIREVGGELYSVNVMEGGF